MAKGDFIIDLARIRERAETDVRSGAVVDYKAELPTVLGMLDHALATECVCVLRYRQNASMCQGTYAETVVDEFLEHARDEQHHAEMITERITQLGGVPDLNPATLIARSSTEYSQGESLFEMIENNLIAERIVIEIYGAMIRYVGDQDPTTRRMLEKILKDEEDHADELADLMAAVDPHKKIAN